MTQHDTWQADQQLRRERRERARIALGDIQGIAHALGEDVPEMVFVARTLQKVAEAAKEMLAEIL